MKTTAKDTTDSKPSPARRRAPRPRTPKPGGDQVKLPPHYTKARQEFEAGAQRWLLKRPGRVMEMPDDLLPIATLGVPCRTCGASVYRQGDAGHTIEWKPKSKGDPAGHWAAGITARCDRQV